MLIRWNKLAGVLGALVWLLLSRAHATTVIPPTFEEMAERAELIFVGRVVGSHAEWRLAGTRRVIFTQVEFENLELLKGKAEQRVTLQFLGGTVGDATLEVAGVPKFKAEERVLLFVERNGAQFCPIVGVYHGKFGLRKDSKTGRDIVLRHDGRPLRGVDEIGAEEGMKFGLGRDPLTLQASRVPMSVDDFKGKVRERLIKNAGPK